jgi:Xaa-Pro aminopeptidase
VLPRDPAKEAWTGARLGVSGAASLTGMDVRPVSQFRGALDSALAGSKTLYAVGDLDATATLSYDDQFAASLKRVHVALQVVDAGGHVDSLRSRKSAEEFVLLRRAIDITVEAERAGLRTIAPAVNEYQVQAAIEFTFRNAGAERPAFASIVGSGANSTSLHYNAADQPMRAGDLVVMDVGASFHGYSADVTRTAPVSGTFSTAQRELYQVVRDAQAAAERQAKPRGSYRALVDSSNAVLSAGLARLGLIESAGAVYDAPAGACVRFVKNGCLQLSLYYDHALGHGIGLEVHDPDPWGYAPFELVPGSAFTIEPGLYVRGNALDILPDTPRNRAMIARIRPAFDRYRDLGVRIEDDYFVTDTGVEWVSRAPREIAEIEAAMKR